LNINVGILDGLGAYVSTCVMVDDQSENGQAVMGNLSLVVEWKNRFKHKLNECTYCFMFLFF
jgi:hypothetical protein